MDYLRVIAPDHDRRAGPTSPARIALAAGVAAGVTRRSGAPWWASAVSGSYAGLAITLAGPAQASFRTWRESAQGWSALLLRSHVARGLHDWAGGVQPPVRAGLTALEDVRPAEAARLGAEYDAIRARAAERLSEWSKPQPPWVWEALNEGYLGGQRLARLPGSPVLVRYFAVYENTPAWLPPPGRRLLVPLLRVVDVVRLLHTDAIERRVLVGTLWLRAIIVTAAPFTAAASFTGLVPREGASPLALGVYAACVAASWSAAVAGRRLSAHTIGRPTRWGLYASEQVASVAAVIAFPCWAMAILASGAVNWLERPDWTSRRLLAWMALTYVPFAASATAAGREPQAVAFEAGVAIAATAVMAGSYGMMAPVTAATLLRALFDSVVWRGQALAFLARERRELKALVADLETALRASSGESGAARDALGQLKQARAGLAIPWDGLRRKPRRIRHLLARAISATVVPQAAVVESAPRLRGVPPVFRPPELGDRLVRGGRNARRLDRLLRRIVQEAVDKDARGLIFTYVRSMTGGGIELEVANVFPDRPLAGFGTGSSWLELDRVGIPGVEIVSRGTRTEDHPELMGEVFSVVIRIDGSVLEGAE